MKIQKNNQVGSTSNLIAVVMTLIVVGIGAYYLGAKNSNSDTPPMTSPIKNGTTKSAETDNGEPDVVEPEGWNSHTIPDMNLTFMAPEDLEVTTESQRNDADEVYAVTLYLQKGMQQTDFYQLYGIYSIGPDYTEATLEEYRAELEPDSIEEHKVSGFPALSGQIRGERNRFVTYVITDIGRLGLFTAQPTIENKELSDEIIDTFKFTD